MLPNVKELTPVFQCIFLTRETPFQLILSATVTKVLSQLKISQENQRPTKKHFSTKYSQVNSGIIQRGSHTMTCGIHPTNARKIIQYDTTYALNEGQSSPGISAESGTLCPNPVSSTHTGFVVLGISSF